MRRHIDDLLHIRKVTLVALRALDGFVWHTATGELHSQYKEMPNWIEFKSKADLKLAYRAFVEIFAPHVPGMKDVNITVSYSVGNHQVSFLNSTAEVLAALSDPEFETE